MKTNSITSLVAVLGATAALNLSALAGPGIQSHGQAQSVSQQTPTIAFGGSKLSGSVSRSTPYVFTTSGRVSAPSVTQVPGPHGQVLVYRW